MAKLKRYTDFTDLKLTASGNQKSDIVNLNKVKELEKFFEVLRNNVVVKKKSHNKSIAMENSFINDLIKVCKVLEHYGMNI